MWVVKLSGDIIKVHSEEKIKFLKSVGFFVTSVYVEAIQYALCLQNRDKNNRDYKYHDYFKSAK